MKFVTFVTAVAVIANASSLATKCCGFLSQTTNLRSKVFYPNSTVYSARLDSIYSKSAREPPWCVVMPNSTQDTSDVMKVISRAKCPFGIRGGGHGMHALSNSIEYGVTIDFGNMNVTSYNADKAIVAVGPGTRSAPAYRALEPFGVWLTAGRIAPVGVSGFILGGGISCLWASHGWASDNVVNFEMVLADGSVVNANEKQNRDLWVAQRGGSGNFGLVTRYDMRAVQYADPSNPKIWGGGIFYDYNSSKDQFIDEFIKFGKGHATDTNSAAVFVFLYRSSTDSWNMISLLSNAANIPNAPILKPIIGMGTQLGNSLRSDTMANFATENTEPGNVYNIWFTSTFNIDSRILRYIQIHHPELVAQLRQALPRASFTSRVTYHALTPTVVSHAKGNNVLGLERHVANGNIGVIWLIWVELDTADDEATAIPIVQAWHRQVNAYATQLGVNWNWEYLNYANGLQDPISKYGKENIQKLNMASKKYDPSNVFQKLRGSGFKLPDP